MSYQVLARKWRPRDFTELVGQEHVQRALVNALDNDRLHHAYLFTGTRGVGKTTIARILAKSLNCETGVTSTPCGKCSACEEINAGRFIDLLEVDAASRTKVEDTRELLENVQYAPTRGRYKVYLIDEVHMLSKSAFNALLKTLEEPPAHVMFIFATTEPQKIPVTILSRCQIISFGSLDHKDMAQVLMQENDMEESLAFTLAAVAEGSLGRAKLLWQEGLLSLRQELVEGLLLGQQNPAETIAQVFRLSEKGAALKENASELLALIRLWYRDLFLVAAGGPEASIANKDLALFLPAAAQLWSLRQLQQKLQRLDLAERQLLRNCNRTLVLETLFFDLI